ncbi:MAG TPA: D-2-hydroxyacid dehydrogenase [Candidatus Marinimicrobia bacterium]|nr:D-2-hydroxyacid dehydrogenase [Candidatus Neomarinimicrobiota bacterium]
MSSLKVGIQLTKNPEKYKYLLSVLKSELHTTSGLEFVHIPTDEKLTKMIPELDILTTYHIKETSFSNAIAQLKWIHFGVAGLEHSLFPKLLKSKTTITNASGVHAGPVSEFVISTILYFAKRFKDCYEFIQTTNWTQWEVAKQMVQLKGKTIGIIGFGSLGKAIAKKAKAFDMKVIATRRLQKKVEHKKTVDELIPVSNLSHLLKNSDFVVIACPLTPVTKNMIGKRELSEMKSTAFIINIARGEIINEAALINALQNKTLAGAALDVFEKEPLPKESPLFALDNVFLSPHISGNFPEYQHDVMVQFANNLNRYLAGKDLKNRVCKKRLY